MEREDYMRAALELARQASETGDVPVGAVVADKAGTIIGRGRNRREERKSAVHHAEIEAIEQACAAVGSWRLDGCALYVTLEPCPMCAGAAALSGVERVIFGAYDPRAGCAGSVYAIPEDPAFGAGVVCEGGVLETECAAVLDAFFVARRQQTQEGV